VYSALWKILPGPRWLKGLQAVTLAIIAVVILFELVFPWFAQEFLGEDSTVESQSIQEGFKLVTNQGLGFAPDPNSGRLQ
jgi:hypothetical protein